MIRALSNSSVKTGLGFKNLRTTSLPFLKTSGGEIYFSNTHVYHVFRANGTFTASASLSNVEVLSIAGGASGGCSHSTSTPLSGGGGGAGGVKFYSIASVLAGDYSAVIGAGASRRTSQGIGFNGTESYTTLDYGNTIATGGGGGGASNGFAGQNGGSGGGAGTVQSNTGLGGTGVAGQGFAGGRTNAPNTAAWGQGGGGGGAGGVGNAGNSTLADPISRGGIGTSAYSDWGLATGTGVLESDNLRYFAGGGGGSGYWLYQPQGGFGGGGKGGRFNSTAFGDAGSRADATSGIVNTGAGGGGAAADSSTQVPVALGSGAGGSGIIIVRYIP